MEGGKGYVEGWGVMERGGGISGGVRVMERGGRDKETVRERSPL